jgi:hypothetical protein
VIEDILFTSFCAAAGALMLLLIVRRRVSARVWRVAKYGFAAHCAAVFAQVLITREVYGSGDIFEYWRSGVVVAEAMRDDPVAYTPELIRAFFHQSFQLPFEIFGQGPTLSQSGADPSARRERRRFRAVALG